MRPGAGHPRAVATARAALPLAALALAPGVSAQPAPPPVIDTHVHAAFTDDGSGGVDVPNTRARLLLERETSNVVGSVVHLPLGVYEPDEPLPATRYCAGVPGEPDLDRLERALASGRSHCVKIRLGYVHRWAADPAYTPVYRMAARFGVPVVFHTGDTWSSRAKLKYADPLTVDEVAVDHPDVTFVVAHCGNPWIESAAEVAYKNPNVVLECSAMLTGNLGDLDPADVATYVTGPIRWILGYVEDPSKLMFGTDWPLVDVAAYLAAYRAAVPRRHWDAVFHDNAARVFGFPR